jgi:predicted RNA binding protein YcfA (HicA-like mRNA interferase family)
VPPKIRELAGRLEQAGFRFRGGKESHRNYVHEASRVRVTLSGRLGDDAKRYQEREVRRAIEKTRTCT